jgi:hypothetical protein
VLPRYVGSGLGVMLTQTIISKVLAWGAQELEFSWVAESNAASRGTLENGGARVVKRYRVYEDASLLVLGDGPKTSRRVAARR